MAEGTSRPIQSVVIGDLVVGGQGLINQVYAIETPALRDRLLYAINDDQHFVTGSHPFLIDDGWKAIDPANTYREHNLRNVGRLMVGDRIVMLSGVLAAIGSGATSATTSLSVDIHTEPFPVERIEGISADPDLTVYNLMLDGNHTYFANDLLVHNR